VYVPYGALRSGHGGRVQDGEELSARPLRSEQRSLRVLDRGDRQVPERRGPVVVHVRARRPREERRGPTRKRRRFFAFETIHTLRFAFLQRAGVIVHPDGYATLDVGRPPAVMERFREVDRLFEAA
jgi:hypothetical protein